MNPIYNKLLHIESKGDKTGAPHSKIDALKKIILEITKTNRNSKILILFCRHFESVASEVKYFLGKDFLVNYYPTLDSLEEDYKEIFLSSVVILGKVSNYILSCPWKIFSHVIQYESNEETKWYEIGHTNNPHLKFTSLNAVFNRKYDLTTRKVEGINCFLYFFISWFTLKPGFH